tara:strand:- start:656 stop:997 length:342 start_codon:yes stop_codon:yes gene_type:complete
MWIAHSKGEGGWLSIVSHKFKPECLMVRAREEEHITSLWPDVEIYTPEGRHDYQHRADIPREEVARVITEYIVSEITYPDFKSSVDGSWELKDAFSDIWHVMRKQFGAGWDNE